MDRKKDSTGAVKTAPAMRSFNQTDVERVEQQLAELEGKNIVELREVWVERFGGRAPAFQSKDILRRLIAWKIQEKAFGGLDPETKSRLGRMKAAYLAGKPIAPSPSVGLSPGTILSREWKGIVHRVLVLEGGFEHEGKRYGTLTKLARAITGTRWSGPRFFGLDEGQSVARVLKGRKNK